MKTHPVPIAAMMFLFAAAPLAAGPLDGTIQLGGIVLDEEGDKSTVQETYNIYDGFNLSRIFLEGTRKDRPKPDGPSEAEP